MATTKRRSSPTKPQQQQRSQPVPTTPLEKQDPSSEPPLLLAAEPTGKKWRNWWLRTITTFMMIGSFFTVLASGHIWVILMVIAIQTIVYNEVVQIADIPAKERSVKWFKTMSW